MNNLSAGNAKGMMEAMQGEQPKKKTAPIVTEKKEFDAKAYKKTLVELIKKAEALNSELDKLGTIKATKELGDAKIMFSTCMDNIEKLTETV